MKEKTINKIVKELDDGKLKDIGKAVSIFGGARIKPGTEYYNCLLYTSPSPRDS